VGDLRVSELSPETSARLQNIPVDLRLRPERVGGNLGARDLATGQYIPGVSGGSGRLPIPTKIEIDDYKDGFLGHGAWKEVYGLKNRDDLVVAMTLPSQYPLDNKGVALKGPALYAHLADDLSLEHGELLDLHELGFDVVRSYGVVPVRGAFGRAVPGLLLERVPGSAPDTAPIHSKDILKYSSLEDTRRASSSVVSPSTSDFPHFRLRSKTIESLIRTRELLIEKDITIHDLQFIIDGRTGAARIADPNGIDPGFSASNLQKIDKLIEFFSRGGRRR